MPKQKSSQPNDFSHLLSDDEQDTKNHSVADAQDDSEPLVEVGNELVEYAAQGLIALWQVVDLICINMGWNWVKEDQSKSYSKVYASPEGVSTRHVGILFNAAVTTKPQYILDPDGNTSLTATQRAEAKLFIDGVKSNLFIGLGSATEDGYRESDFKRLLMLPNPTVPTIGTEEQSSLIVRANIAADNQLSDGLKPIVVNWRISELKKWVSDYRDDNRADILLYHSGAQGYIDIYNEYPRPMVGMRCDHPVNGAIELIPYLLEGATPSAIAELQRWHDALTAATLSTTSTNQGGKTIGKYDRDYIPPDLPEELHDFWRDNWIQREAARLSTAYERVEKAWAETVITNPPNTALTNEEAAAELSYIERKIKDTYDLIVTEGELYPTDETIAARLPIGRKGQPYTRETVNRYRNKMRGRGIEV